MKRTETSYTALRNRILASMILLPFVPFMLVLGIGYISFTNSLENGAKSAMARIVDDHRLMIDAFLEERRGDLAFAAASLGFADLARMDRLAEVFSLLKAKSGAFADLGVFNPDGVHVAYVGPYQLTGKNYRDAPWFAEAVRRGYYISDVFLGYRQIPHFVVAVTRAAHDGVWILRATIDTQVFNHLVKSVRIGQTGEAYIINSRGELQTERRSGGRLMSPVAESDRFLSIETNGIHTFLHSSSAGGEFLYAGTWLQGKQWLLLVSQEKSEAFGALRSAASRIVLISVLGGAVIVLAAFHLTSSIVARMHQMDRAQDRLNRQLIGATRLAELGEMAAGFAHEINNPLQIISSEHKLIETILEDLKAAGRLQPCEDLRELEESVAQIQLQVSRCAQITQAILKFGRQGEPQTVDIDLRRFVPEAAAMVRKKAEVHGIAFDVSVDDDMAGIHGDPAQLQQVLLNLFNNAFHAVTERHGAAGGRLAVRGYRSDNGLAVLEVRDNGTGITESDLKKIFRPFFTTKTVGQGTGLGLAVCYGIIDKMGGSLEVASERGTGTTFTIRLPAAGTGSG